MVVNTIPTDLYKSFWQDVHGKPAQEFNTIEDNRLFDGPVAVIFGNESYLSIFYVQDALICNCHPVSVLTKIFNNVFSICHRRFAMYHPGGFICCLHLVVEQGQLIMFSQGTFKAVEELAFKGIAKLMHRIKVFTGMTDSLLLCF